MKPTLEDRIEELERGLISAGVPVDVERRTKEWLTGAATAMNAKLGRPAPTTGEPARSLTAGTDAARVRRAALGEARDVAWLCATASGGGLLERRAALVRLSALAPNCDRSERAAIEALLARRHAGELGLDAMRVAITLSAASARDARERFEAARALGARFAEMLAAFVEGGSDEEPLAALSQSERAQLFLHLRDSVGRHRGLRRIGVGAQHRRRRRLGGNARCPRRCAPHGHERGRNQPGLECRRHRATTANAVWLVESPRRAKALRRSTPGAEPRACRARRRTPRRARVGRERVGTLDDPRVPRALLAAWTRATDVAERLVLAKDGSLAIGAA